MNNQERKEALAARVEELAYRTDNMKTKDNHQKKKKCSECGKGFLGQSDATTCGPTCRKRKSRS